MGASSAGFSLDGHVTLGQLLILYNIVSVSSCVELE